MKKDWQGTAIVILSIVLLLMVAFLGYIIYERNNGTLASSKDCTEEKTSNSEVTLDVNSLLIKKLYDMLTLKSGNSNCGSSMFGMDEFDIKTATEEKKMRIVSNNLNSGNIEVTDCSYDWGKTVPRNLKDNSISNLASNLNYNICYHDSDKLSSYKAKYVEEVYKELFGQDAVLDKSIAFYTGDLLPIWAYVKSADRYVAYAPEVYGYECGPRASYKSTLLSASKKGNEIHFTENVVESDFNYDTEKYETQEQKFEYIFKLDKGGLYSFVSRKKVN